MADTFKSMFNKSKQKNKSLNDEYTKLFNRKLQLQTRLKEKKEQLETLEQSNSASVSRLTDTFAKHCEHKDKKQKPSALDSALSNINIYED